MKERGKAVETYGGEYYSTSDLPCRKHPSSSSVGICAYCLKDRLIKLVCSDCGEQRLSSCSCSEISSNPNSCTVEVGSVGRISFLIENEKGERGEVSHSSSKQKIEERSEQAVLLKRSSSSSVEIKRTKSGFWGIGRLFRKRRDKDFDEKREPWMFDYMGGVSRSRSLCSFRGGGFNESEDSDLTHSNARTSGVNGGLPFDSEKRSGFSEDEARRSGFSCPEKRDYDSLDSRTGLDFKSVKKGLRRSGFLLKESDFSGVDDSGFIDLKLDFSSESKPDLLSAMKMSALSDSGSCFSSMRGTGLDFAGHECGGCSFGNLISDDDGGFGHGGGGSCRITVNERGMKKGRKSLKVWRWILRNHPSWVSASARKKDEDQIFKS